MPNKTDKSEQMPSRATWRVLDAFVHNTIRKMHMEDRVELEEIWALEDMGWLDVTEEPLAAYSISDAGRAAWERGRKRWGDA